MRFRSTRGFTLVELMIVVGIIGTLASVAIPTFNGYMLKTRDSEAISYIKEMSDGLAAYYQLEHVTQGAAAAHNTHCLPQSAGPHPFPIIKDDKQVGAFASNATFVALNFIPTGPVQFSYLVWNGNGASLCNIQNLGSEGSVVGYSDYDGDDNLRIRATQFTIIDSKMVRHPGIYLIEDFPNPY